MDLTLVLIVLCVLELIVIAFLLEKTKIQNYSKEAEQIEKDKKELEDLAETYRQEDVIVCDTCGYLNSVSNDSDSYHKCVCNKYDLYSKSGKKSVKKMQKFINKYSSSYTR